MEDVEAIIRTERMTLRPPAMSDAERLTALIGDYDVCKMLTRVPYPYHLKDAKAWLSTLPARAAAGEAFNRALDSGDGIAGVIGIHDIREIEGEKIGELGYWLAKPYWGKGLMTEAGRAFLRHAFEELGLVGLKSGHFKENFRSGRVLAKLGFRFAGEGFMNCISRNAEIPHVDVVMTRAQWRDYTAKRAA